ncbi:PREDICTED: nucleolar complex protein 2 homolog [Nicrophorus vespilloides]|uniref:Nucleolar complex protein 2 homolog n=1 Tax=Nicrophorus vespilloides TaxID=110193 RepID=A0ABM1MJ95_NICVS|nr:PREDICTED: nucleolar complex protein 2 homolog [Nicrophorus vespilloides]
MAKFKKKPISAKAMNGNAKNNKRKPQREEPEESEDEVESEGEDVDLNSEAEDDSEIEMSDSEDADNEEEEEDEGGNLIDGEAEEVDEECEEEEEDEELDMNEECEDEEDEELEIDEGSEGDNNEDEDLEKDDESEAEDDPKEHKKALERLQETDPEFYKFLKDNDKKLLKFNISDSEDDDEDDQDVDLHKPSDDLEVASDESDFEDETKTHVDDRVITLKKIKQWQEEIKVDKTKNTIVCLINAFKAALVRIDGDEDQSVEYKVDGSAVFNGVMQLCVLELGPAIRKFLGYKSGSKMPVNKLKKYVKIRAHLYNYFGSLSKLINNISSNHILTVLLKHLHYMSPLMVEFSGITKLLKGLVKVWSTGDESVRVVAFLCILRFTRSNQQQHLDSILKQMYLSYIKNSKFVSANTLPAINFMRRSLVEMFALDLNVTYQHAFLYIRQLAINLRNAITVNKKENIQTVYNWQYINSLKLWGNLLEVTCDKPQLQPLVYPFVQVCLGTIKLVPTAAFYPLRFHVLQILIEFSRQNRVYVPILPFILEVLQLDFNKKHKKVSMKPLNLNLMLRVSKGQQNENGYKTALVEHVYSMVLEYMSIQSQSIAFPDLALICTIQLKKFVKNCKDSNYQKKISQLLDKIKQNSDFIEKERTKVSMSLNEFNLIEGWESNVKNKGTPLNAFHENWSKVNQLKRKKQANKTDEIAEYNLPTLKKFKKENVKREDGPVELFPSDSEDELSIEKKEVDGDASKKVKTQSQSEKKKLKKKSKKTKGSTMEIDEINASGEGDIVQDFNVSDW